MINLFYILKHMIKIIILFISLSIIGCNPSNGNKGNSGSIVSLSITPANSKSPIGVIKIFKALATYGNGSQKDITTLVAWSSSNISVATISNSESSIGYATPVAVGTTTITASYGGLSSGTTLTITSAILSSIIVTPVESSVPLGLSQQFAAQGIFSDSSVESITLSASWSSSNTSVATIGNSIGNKGLESSVSVGTAKITATLNGISGSTNLTVIPAIIASIVVSPSPAYVATNSTTVFTATGIYSNGSQATIPSSSLTWSSSSIANATINTSGMALGISPGISYIMASYASLTSNNALLYVTPQYNRLYVSNVSGTTVDYATVTPQTGAVSTFATAAATGLSGPAGMGFYQNGSNYYFYVANNTGNSISLCNVSSSTGLFSGCVAAVTGLVSTIVGLGINNNFLYLQYYNTNNIGIYSITPASGALTLQTLFTTGGFSGPDGIGFNNGYAYIANQSATPGTNSASSCVVNNITGFLSSCNYIGASGINTPQGATIFNGFIYFVNTNNNNISVCSLTTNGALTNCQLSGTNMNIPTSIAIIAGFAYVTNAGNNTLTIYSVDAVTGLLTYQSSNNGGGLFNSPNFIVTQ